MAAGILVLVAHPDGGPRKTAFELLSKATELNIGPVMAGVIGDAGLDLSASLASHGATKVFYATSAELATPQTGPWARALEAIIKAADPQVVLAASSTIVKDIFPRMAVRFQAGLASECTELAAAGDRLTARRPIFAGKAITDVEIPKGIQFFTTRPNSFAVGAADESKSAETMSVSVALQDEDLKARVVEVSKSASGKVDLTEADRIVSAGRSIGSADNFKVIEAVADVLGASVGASRAAVDAGYAAHDIQVGQTGKTVNPTLYIAFGISGAIQHVAGMRSSKVIVAVNKDAEAPIFQIADYGIVADLFEVAPMMAVEIQKVIG